MAQWSVRWNSKPKKSKIIDTGGNKSIITHNDWLKSIAVAEKTQQCCWTGILTTLAPFLSTRFRSRVLGLLGVGSLASQPFHHSTAFSRKNMQRDHWILFSTFWAQATWADVPDCGHTGFLPGQQQRRAGLRGLGLRRLQQQLLSHPALLSVPQKLHIPSSLLEPVSKMDKWVSWQPGNQGWERNQEIRSGHLFVRLSQDRTTV